ncbi:hypothetical protein APF79_00740 [bacterium BRH_c32]|nr:MAG: hypothetical protein APF79_00740 [bacterium BRH_c32]
MENHQNFKIIDKEIIYRKFSNTDFSEPGFNVIQKEISPNDEGYVSEGILSIVGDTLNDKNSTVINAAVGQGKTTAVFELIKKYFEETEEIIVIAVPYRALVSKYANRIKDEITSDGFSTIFDLEKDFENRNELDAIIGKRIHIVTVNLLLRNSGDFFFQNKIKQRYLDNFITRATKRNRKLIFFFDEIHAAVHNFSSENIFSFLKFKEITKKIFYISATYTEATLMVVKLLSILTDNNILLIDAKRIRNSKANLHLLITPKRYSSKNTEILRYLLGNVIKSAIRGNKQLNILSYSKELAKSIGGKGVNKEAMSLYSVFNKLGVKDKLNIIVSKDNYKTSAQDSVEIDEVKINIGTTFNTGIDITGGTFIIIMPDATILNDISDNYGVFTEGANAIFQAVGRMRGEGDIYIVMGKSKELIYPIHTRYDLHLGISKYFRMSNVPSDFPFNSNDDSMLLERYYDKKYSDNENEINKYQKLSSEKGKELTLRYPSYSEWVMQNGQNFLSSEYLFYGKKLTPITVWAALHNQFQNCTLKSIELFAIRVDFSKANLFEDCYNFIEDIYSENLGEMEIEEGIILSGIVDNLEHRLYKLSDYEIFNLLIDKLNEYSIFIDDKELTNGVDVALKSVILKVIGKRKKGIDNYSKENYLLDLISFSKQFNANNQPLDTETEFRNDELVGLGKELDELISELSLILNTRGYIYKEFKSDPLKETYRQLMEQIVQKCRKIGEKDKLISLNGFDLFRTENIGLIYKQIYLSLFETREFEPPRRGFSLDINGTSGKVIELIERKPYSTLSTGINSLYTYKYDTIKWYSHTGLVVL